MICLICNTEQDLRTHLKTHKITAKMYYDKFLLKNNEGMCKLCGKPTKFVTMTIGYRTWCSNKCRQNDQDEIKYRVQKYKLSGSGIEKRKETWKNKSIEEKQNILNKVKNTILLKYGVEYYSQTKEWKDKVPDKISETNKNLIKIDKNYFHSENYVNPFTNSDRIVSRKRELHNGNYFSENYYTQVKERPILKTYVLANMIKYVPERYGNCIC